MKLIIIGNGPAAVNAVEAFRSVDSSSEIVMIARDEVGAGSPRPYSPCPLAEYVEGAVTRASLFLRDETFYQSLRVTTLWGREVERVLPEAHQVRLSDGQAIGYDRLLIAAGASAIRPPIPGLEKTGVFPLKTLADADAILAYLPTARRALVIGAGFIGLEAAQALQRRGLAVTVVEILDRVLPQMLDADMAALVQKRLEEHGVQVRTSSRVNAVLGNGRVTGAVVDDREIPCDLIIYAAGVRPNVELVVNPSAPLRTSTGIAADVGILVDEHTRTSDPDVYAAGDIAQGFDLFGERRVIATWTNAGSGGRVAGYNLAGAHCHLPGLEDANVVRVFGLPVVSLGRRGMESALALAPTTLQRARDGTVAKLMLAEGRVVGLQMVGAVDGAGVFLGLIKQRRDVRALGEDLLDVRFNYGWLMKPVGQPAALRR